MKKKLILLFLITSLFFVGCEATEPQIQEAIGTEGLQYEKTEDGTGYIVTGYIGSEKDVIIPGNYNFAPVVEIKEYAFRENKNIESVYISSSVKKIGTEAFLLCSNLKTVSLNEGLQEICMGAFAYSNIEKIVIPNSVKLIDEWVFDQCDNLRIISITNPDTEVYSSAFKLTKYVLGPQNWKKGGVYIDNILICMGNAYWHGGAPFYDNGEYVSDRGLFKIQEGTKSIAKMALRDDTTPTQVIFPEGVKRIHGEFATNCNKLVSVTLPTTLEYIGEKFVSKCQAFSTINYSGTKEQWEKIEKHPEWDIDMKSYVIHCSDGDIEIPK